MKVIILCALVFAVFGSDKFPTPDYHNTRHVNAFKQWKKHFGKTYANFEEEAHRFSVFMDNWKMIHEHNERKESFQMGLNQFGDLTGDEFKLYVHGHMGSCLRGHKAANKLTKETDSSSSSSSSSSEDVVKPVSAPASIDWEAKGKVTPVKNQGQCGSCWAFSTTGSIESRVAIKTGSLKSLSEQQLVDCSGSYGNDGCNGGLMDNAFRYVQAVGGLCAESAYRYTARDGSCKASSCGTKYDDISGHRDVTRDSESALVDQIAVGPVSIGVEADQQAFQFYKSGVLTGTCGTGIDHGVLAVGYGTMNGQDYYKVKNSWGTSWGNNGYLLICRNCGKNGGQGECGILDQASYPIAA